MDIYWKCQCCLAWLKLKMFKHKLTYMHLRLNSQAVTQSSLCFSSKVLWKKKTALLYQDTAANCSGDTGRNNGGHYP